MAADITSDDFVAKSSDVLAGEEAQLQAAHAQAIAELNRIREKASIDDKTAATNAEYSMHDVLGVGRYVIPRKLGWKNLLKIIHDPVPNIDFSAKIYPAFDAILGEHFNSPFLLDPLDDKYESYESLRDNLAAVRNFLMESYYAQTPVGMTPEKAKASLAEIAAFVGDGLYNNWVYYGLVHTHKHGEPHIDLKTARKTGGVGAQYIYDKILEHQRHSSWMRPFDMVLELFGGKKAPDWKLPASDATHFNDRENHELMAAATAAAASESIEAAAARVNAIEAHMAAVRDAKALSITATDLDAIGNHLLFTAENMAGVAQLNEGVRLNAVAIAKDILRKLKVSIGNLQVMDGLQMKPSDDMAVLGAVKGVATVYERLLAWARGNNDSEILQHPSILAATQAVGQLGYLAKLEALRMAKLAKNNVLVENIGEQLKRIPDSYRNVGQRTFGELLDTVEHGIDTVINRIQQVSVSGAKIGKSVDNVGTSMDAPPTAGTANLTGNSQAAQLNAQLIAAQQLAALAQANRGGTNTQSAPPRAAQAPQTATGTGMTGNAPARTGTNGQLARARQQQQRANSTTSSTNPADHHGPAPMTPAQLAAMNNNAAARAAKAAHDQEEAHHHDMQMQQLRDQQLRAAKAAALKAAAAKIDPNMVKGFNMKGITGDGKALQPGRNIKPSEVMKPTAKSQMQAAPSVTPAPATANSPDPLDPLKHPHTVQPTPPGRGGGGRGF